MNDYRLFDDDKYTVKIVSHDKMLEEWLFNNRVLYIGHTRVIFSIEGRRRINCCFCYNTKAIYFIYLWHRHIICKCNYRYPHTRGLMRGFETCVCKRCRYRSEEITKTSLQFIKNILWMWSCDMSKDVVTLIAKFFDTHRFIGGPSVFIEC